MAPFAIGIAGALQAVLAFPACLAGEEDEQAGMSVAQVPLRRAALSWWLLLDGDVDRRNAEELSGLWRT
ncbi:hypothetical protein GCM10010344_63660 [Streptomyces bluensis]|nr:hypothetical protein GCM10010344_63660 [Streptomyces bluensis]